jgi:hypothetical protein
LESVANFESLAEQLYVIADKYDVPSLKVWVLGLKLYSIF